MTISTKRKSKLDLCLHQVGRGMSWLCSTITFSPWDMCRINMKWTTFWPMICFSHFTDGVGWWGGKSQLSRHTASFSHISQWTLLFRSLNSCLTPYAVSLWFKCPLALKCACDKGERGPIGLQVSVWTWPASPSSSPRHQYIEITAPFWIEHPVVDDYFQFDGLYSTNTRSLPWCLHVR